MFKIRIFWFSFVIVVDSLSFKPHMKTHISKYYKDTLEKSPSKEKYTAEQSDLQLLREKTTDRDGMKKNIANCFRRIALSSNSFLKPFHLES